MASSLVTAAVVAASVAVYPAPGVSTASPTTQISFRGTTDLGTVTVTGSRSGRHRGRVREHSDGQGASWLPSRRFTSGETVRVRSRARRYSFKVGRRPAPAPTRRITRDMKADVQSFASRPDLTPPRLWVDQAQPGRTPGFTFLGPKGGREMGPMVIDDRGQLVWFRELPRDTAAFDVRVQSYRGEPVITWWQGKLVGGGGRGEGVIFDAEYDLVRRVRMGNGFKADSHEFTLTPNGTALLIGYDAVYRDEGRVLQAVVQEVDVATGLVLFEWHSIGNVATAESYRRRVSRRQHLDYMHLNSVAVAEGGDFVLSARGTNAVYKVSRATGRVLWRLGGKRSDFRQDAGTRFFEQHDVRPGPDDTLTLFDNARRGHRSRALTVRLDGRRARLVASRTHPLDLHASTQGGVQPLPDGHTFVGWGSQRWFTEFDAAGRVVFDGRLARGMDSYRAYRAAWVGTPKTRPVAVRRGKRLHVSWNGATQVAAWVVNGRRYPRTGFETRLPAPSARAVVRAVDAAGTVLGESRKA
ncbi:aryl-sulfate sulfotransferase [Solirubrobacter sp. CPCC 204708]|uniref:Arylsulfotransferase family protein n=1 Tax=Solirubrobacter deserti TaxID=2282478 RepID=A0ABT4RQ77_9ACTN|nr:arylsulfotransferase family protein [Solirubrobacter deserti]MBE2320645.1 aryl-sulfate sulfotransferase [Solirubrobacter deserti]MDA0140699.1 arylsulfotransferase family protein [Solirubrobacter deserti]